MNTPETQKKSESYVLEVPVNLTSAIKRTTVVVVFSPRFSLTVEHRSFNLGIKGWNPPENGLFQE